LKTLLIILLFLPTKTVFNDEFCTLVVKTWYYEEQLETMQKTPLFRGENKKMKAKRINRMKNRIEVLKAIQSGYKLDKKYETDLY